MSQRLLPGKKQKQTDHNFLQTPHSEHAMQPSAYQMFGDVGENILHTTHTTRADIAN